MKTPDSAGISREISPRGKIQVLHLVTSLEPGGMENGVVNISNRLDPLKFATTIACLERVGDFARRLREDVKVICFDKPPGFRFSVTPQLARAIRSVGADVLHTHNLGPLIYGTLGNILTGGRSVLLQGEHGQMRPDEMTPKRRWLRKAGYSACGAVHTVSAGLRTDLIDHGFSGEKIRVIINGVDCERFSPAAPEERASLREGWKLEKDSVVLGIVGRFAAFKRHTRLIEAFERLSPAQPRLRLLIVGDHGTAREAILRKIEESPVKDKIVWAGYQSDPVDFYKMMDLLVVPSDCEGLSNVMLEAMACAVPCLAHPACGANEVVVDGVNGFLREMATPEALASVLGGIASDLPLLAELGAGARSTAEQRFSLASMVNGYARLYEELAGRKRGSGS
ncbi:glycosyltransferase [Luteolibacter sp. SL250]|uniref:glycosyltransferase n=1 Tax=Luteolibacter sp. SL250 TaxID=2995170 RepID=UPI0022703DC1|nr:glycosyltransferase [Luteolibacter sp. SL250]WAC19625.1 glycosyltransferase [Luteolibacter sp. SL250]